MKDLKSVIKAIAAIAPVSGKATAAAIAIDRQGYESVTVVSTLGAGAYTSSAYYTPTLTESDDGVTYTAVPENKYIGDLTPVKATISAAEVRTIGYIGDKRYVKFAQVVTGTLGADVIVAAVAVLGHPHLSPVA
ncbi:MAG: hypothetical protein ACQ5SW_00890 [Sphaerochaetaceae bacterium]